MRSSAHLAKSSQACRILLLACVIVTAYLCLQQPPIMTHLTGNIYDKSEPKYELSYGIFQWNHNTLKDWFRDFQKSSIPILDNDGGMRLVHQFGLYAVLRKIRPKYVIESGVFRGVSTNIIRKVLPESYIISIDPYCVHNISATNEYYCGKNFSDFKNMEVRWKTLDKENTFILFDDHQSGFLRTLQALEFGFKHIMIEDNYAYGMGDNYSPKQVLTRVTSDTVLFLDNIGRKNITITKYEHDANRRLFKRIVNTYLEFPTLNKFKTIEWLKISLKFNDVFTTKDLSQITPDGLGLDVPSEVEYHHYRNICYIVLNELTNDIKAMINLVRYPS